MDTIRRHSLDLYYQVLGGGPDLVLIHAFPSCHEMWLPVAERLAMRYRVILPDLRAHGRSGVPDRPALMSDYVADIVALCDELKVGKALFAGVSIGGYILFELWRAMPERIRALALCCTKAAADTPEAKTARLAGAEQALQRGSAQFIESILPRLLGETTQRNRRDVVNTARQTMRFMTPQGIAMVQRGMAERPDSAATLPAIKVPVQLIGGEEDTLAPPAEMHRMRDAITSSELDIVPRSGHYAPLEAPEHCFRILRRFCDAHAK